MSALIQISDASKFYQSGGRPALDRISLAVDGGEFVAIMGPSGCGKSTLLNLMAGLDRPTSGHVVVDGAEVSRMGEAGLARFRRTSIGFVFQFFNLLPSITVRENILVPSQLAHHGTRQAEKRAAELLDRLGISPLAGRYPSHLSGGQQQRVAIARALINEPPLLLADEPTGALDSASGLEVMDLLAEVHQHGQAIVMVTHDAKLATRNATRVVSLLDGGILDDAHLNRRTAPAPDVVRIKDEIAP